MRKGHTFAQSSVECTVMGIVRLKEDTKGDVHDAEIDRGMDAHRMIIC